MVCDMHRQCEDASRNLTSTVPAGPWIKIGMNFFQDDSGTEIFNHYRLFLQVPIHLSCHVSSPPKDTEIFKRSVFDQRHTICCDD